jgi:hypothetical protein
MLVASDAPLLTSPNPADYGTVETAMKLALRGFLLALAGEAVVVLAAWIPRRYVQDYHDASATIVWAGLFACATGISVGLISPLKRWMEQRGPLVSIALSVASAIIAYAVAFALTGGTITGLAFPLLLVFLGGSAFAIVGLFWKGGLASAAACLGVILILGLGFSALPFLTTRGRMTHITVVKYTSDNSPQLKIVSAPGVEISEFDRPKLSNLGLHGVLEINRTFSLGPASVNPSHVIIVLTHPVLVITKLPEPESDVIYLQEGNEWKKLPEHSHTTFREVELYPINGNCTAVAVWNTLVQQAGIGGPCWQP